MQQIAFALVLFLCSAFAHAQSTELVCEGVLATHHNGFGKTEIDWSEKNYRLVNLNEKERTVQMQTLFGEKTATLEPQRDSRYFSFVIPLNVEYQGRTVISENVLINRITTEISSMYSVSDPNEKSKSYLSFSGKCKKAERKF